MRPLLLILSALSLAALMALTSCSPQRKIPKAYRKLEKCDCPSAPSTLNFKGRASF